MMMMRSWLLVALLLAPSLCPATGIGTWRNYTSMHDVRGVVRDGQSLWAATSGGLFHWVPATDAYSLWTNGDGLRTVDLTAVGVDRNGSIWTGAANGTLHVISPADNAIRPVLDIATSAQTNKRINAITLTGDTALICSDFGLSVFRISRFEFGDTFSRFGSVSASTRVAVSAAVIFNGSIWACISDGQTINRVATASLSNPNLLPPEAWTLQTVGSPGIVPRSLSVAYGQLYAGTSAGLYVLNAGIWTVVPALSGRSIIATTADTSLLALTIDGETFSITRTGTVTSAGVIPSGTASSIASGPTGTAVIGASLRGLWTTGSSWTSHAPSGPDANQFINITVDNDGVVWCGSGDLTGRGLYRFDGTSWMTFTKSNSRLPADEVYRVSTACNGSVWASTYGGGIVEFPRGSTTIDSNHVFGRNVGISGLADAPNYLVLSNVVCDSRGNTWMSVVLPGDKHVLIVREQSGAWRTFPVLVNGARLTQLQDRPVDRCLAVDAFDNVWATVRDPAYKGVISLGNGGSIDSVAAYLLTTSNGLPSNEVKTVVVDKDNDVWLGTDRGIAIIVDPANPTKDKAIAAYKPLSGLAINCIAIDPLNQKWVGTTEGAFLLSADGTQTLASYTVESTAGRLMDNDVKSIGIDASTGTIYFGTGSGLASLTTSAAAPRQSFDKLDVFPNPFLLPSSSPVTVSGLVAGSSMKIVTSDGRLVRDIKTPGGLSGSWDGRDEDGKVVPSGVYIIVAYSEDGSAVVTGKVAVIRR